MVKSKHSLRQKCPRAEDLQQYLDFKRRLLEGRDPIHTHGDRTGGRQQAGACLFSLLNSAVTHTGSNNIHCGTGPVIGTQAATLRLHSEK